MTKKILFCAAVLLISFLTFFRLLRPGYFSMQDDVQVFRIQQFDECLRDLQFPCRYIAKGGLGYGYPLFNFYPPLPYFIGSLVYKIGLSYINSAKFLFIVGHLFSGLGMFLWARIFWGDWGGLISAVFYIFAPYRAIDGYVRGALGEFWAITITPYIFWLLTAAAKGRDNLKWLGFSFLTGILLLTHNLSALTVLPILLIYCLFFLKKDENIASLKKLFSFLFLSLSLAAFFIFPALLEKKLVTLGTMTQGFFDFRAHFTTLKQLFILRNWGYGASLFGPKDDLSFQIGIFHWLLPVITAGLFFLRRKKNTVGREFWLFLFLGFFAAFLTHNKSTFIWKTLNFMAYYQFPWRFLTMVIFCFSFCAGAAVFLFKNKREKIIAAIFLCFVVAFLNLNYFKEDIWFAGLSDKDKLTGEELIRQSGAGIGDYWPIYGKTYPKSFAPAKPWFSLGSGDIKNFQKGSNYSFCEAEVNAEEAEIVFPIVYYPDWIVKDNGEIVNYHQDEELGLIRVTTNKGLHKFSLKFKETKFRLFFNYFSFFTFIVSIITLLKFLMRKKK